MKYASLFSGIGGLDRAIDSIGGVPVVQVEREPYCLSILGKRWPDVPKVEDVYNYHPEPGSLDLVVGGPPCQPISHAGRRKGADDDRWLWGEALRVVREAQPELAFFENPMGLKTLGLDGILADLLAMGYGGAWEIVAAADVGAPHLRKRIFIMAERGRTGWEGPTRPPGNRGILWPTPTRSDGAGGPGVTPKRAGGINLRTAVQRWPTPSAGDNRDRGNINMPAIQRRIAKGKQLNLSMTVSTSSGALSPDWVEWLMGLPIGWTDVGVGTPGPIYDWGSEPDIPRVGLGIPNRSKRLTALGNAVVPQQAAAALDRLTERMVREEVA